MTKRNRVLAALLLVLLLLPSMPFTANAASRGVYYRPALTFLVENAPSDLLLRVDFERDGEIYPEYLYMETRLWESYFRFYRQKAQSDLIWHGNKADFRGATLVALTGGKEIRIPFPEEALSKLEMNDFFVLDLSDFTLHHGLPLGRTILLFFVRLVLTLGLSLLILYLFQYRWAKSWLAVILTNLVCHSAISLFVSNWVNYNPKQIAVLFLVMLAVLIVEIPIYWRCLDEEDGKRSVTYALWSNVANIVLNLVFVIQFPL